MTRKKIRANITIEDKVIHILKMAKISKNPLLIYKEKNKISWNKLSKEVNLSAQSLYAISKMDKKKIKGIKLGTAIELRKKLGINL